MENSITIKPLKQNNMLETFDKNSNYWLQFEEAEWSSDLRHTNVKLEKVLSIELKGTHELSEENKIPEDTVFIMSVRDAEYLHAWLSVFLKDKV